MRLLLKYKRKSLGKRRVFRNGSQNMEGVTGFTDYHLHVRPVLLLTKSL